MIVDFYIIGGQQPQHLKLTETTASTASVAAAAAALAASALPGRRPVVFDKVRKKKTKIFVIIKRNQTSSESMATLRKRR